MIDRAPKDKNPLRTILLTSLFTALFLFLLLAGGAYWFFKNSINILPAPQSDSSTAKEKPPPRIKNRSSISASEITKVELIESVSKSRAASAAQYFGNVNPSNFTTRTSVISFASDGTATKIVGESGVLNGIAVSPTPQKYIGAVTREKFAELAQVFVENDFLGEEDSKTSTSLPETYTLAITHSGGEKKFKTSNSGNDTPEAEAMLRAFKALENSIGWKKE